jgi:teichuronic acid biosynthesis glycosyltransferase TuaG
MNEFPIKDQVSIIMPAYNCEQFIRYAIESVIAQTYSNWEILIVDDCSTDQTAEIAGTYANKDHRINYISLAENLGAAVARNKAIDFAAGEYIAFLDSDDTWMPTKLEKQISFMKKNGYNFTSTSYNKINEDGKYLGRTIEAKSKSDYEGVLKTCPGNSTVIYNALKLGKFKIPDIKKRNDYVMWLRVIKKEKYLYGLKEPLGNHRIRVGAISSKKTDLIGYHWKVYRQIEKLSLIKSCYLILYWVFHTAFKLR